jgi:hypothetical protein
MIFKFEPLSSLALQELLFSVFGAVVITLMLVVLVEITCLFCALLSDQLDESKQRRPRRSA